MGGTKRRACGRAVALATAAIALVTAAIALAGVVGANAAPTGLSRSRFSRASS
jgi:hypothetical protein